MHQTTPLERLFGDQLEGFFELAARQVEALQKVTGDAMTSGSAIDSVTILRSEGSKVWDADGNQYIDLVNDSGALLFGHDPAFLRNVLRHRFETGSESGLEVDLQTMFCELTGNEGAIFYGSSSEAVKAATRLARGATGRTHILAYESESSLDFLRTHAGQLAAVLIDARDPDVLGEIRAITEDSQTVLILDEQVTGFRVHPGGVQALFGIRGDLTIYGKGTGAGLPIGILAGKAKFLDREAYHAAPGAAPGLALAVCRALLSRLKEAGPQLQEDLRDKGDRVAHALNELFEQASVRARVDHFRSIFQVQNATMLFPGLRRRGVYIQEGSPCFLTTAHSPADIDHIVGAFRDAVAELQVAGLLSAPASAGGTERAFESPQETERGARMLTEGETGAVNSAANVFESSEPEAAMSGFEPWENVLPDLAADGEPKSMASLPPEPEADTTCGPSANVLRGVALARELQFLTALSMKSEAETTAEPGASVVPRVALARELQFLTALSMKSEAETTIEPGAGVVPGIAAAGEPKPVAGSPPKPEADTTFESGASVVPGIAAASESQPLAGSPPEPEADTTCGPRANVLSGVALARELQFLTALSMKSKAETTFEPGASVGPRIAAAGEPKPLAGSPPEPEADTTLEPAPNVLPRVAVARELPFVTALSMKSEAETTFEPGASLAPDMATAGEPKPLAGSPREPEVDTTCGPAPNVLRGVAVPRELPFLTALSMKSKAETTFEPGAIVVPGIAAASETEPLAGLLTKPEAADSASKCGVSVVTALAAAGQPELLAGLSMKPEADTTFEPAPNSLPSIAAASEPQPLTCLPPELAAADATSEHSEGVRPGVAVPPQAEAADPASEPRGSMLPNIAAATEPKPLVFVPSEHFAAAPDVNLRNAEPVQHPAPDPRSTAQAILTAIFQEILETNRVGLDGDLLSLGADSIQLIRIANRANAKGLPLTPKMLLEHHTIRDTADALAGQLTDPDSRTPRVWPRPIVAHPRERFRLKHAV